MFLMTLYTSSFDTGKKFFLDGELKVRGPKREPLLDILLANGSSPWESIFYNNPEAVNYFKHTSPQAQYLNNATTIRLVSNAYKPLNIKPNMKIYNKTTGDTIVTSASTSDITAGSGYIQCANVTGITAQGETTDQVIIGNVLHSEKLDFATIGDDSVTSTVTKYASQIIAHAFDITYSAQAIKEAFANGDADFMQQKERVLRQCEDDLLVAAINGKYAISSANAESGYPLVREMGGIIDSYTRTSNSITALNGSLTLKILGTYLQEINEKKLPLQKNDAWAGSDAEFMMIVNGKTRNTLDYIDSSNVRRDQATRKIITGVTTIEAGGIPVDVITVPKNGLVDGQAIIMHKSQYVLAPVKNSNFAVQEIPVTTRSTLWGISGEFMGCLKYADCIKVISGITL